MKPQRLLYLSSHQMAAYHWQSGALTCEETFAISDAGLQQFAEYLAQHPQTVFSLLTNLADEAFHIETIPYLRGADRKTVLTRKMGQVFFNAPLSAALSLGHEKNRRKDERVLMMALTNLAFLQPWLDAVRASEVPLAGIYSLPLLEPLLLKKLHIPPEPCLLLSVQDQSIRQSYFEKGELHFSRLTSLQHSSIGSIAQTFATESLKLQQYLASQRLIGRNQTITAHILAHPGAFKAVQNSCIDTPTVRFNVLDITECARRTGLKTPPADTHSELLFLHLLVAAPPPIQFANDELRHNFRIGQIRSLLQGAGAMTLIGCLLLSGKFWFDAHTVLQETEALRADAALSAQRYSEVLKALPSVPPDNETLKRVIDRYLIQEKRSTTPIAMYHEISRALQTEPSIELDSLSWQIGGADQAASGLIRQNPNLKTVLDDSESAVVRGTLKPGPSSDTRQLLTTFNRFVGTLRANSTLQVDVLQQPFDIESGKSLRSGETSQEESKPRQFTLQIIRKIGA